MKEVLIGFIAGVLLSNLVKKALLFLSVVLTFILSEKAWPAENINLPSMGLSKIQEVTSKNENVVIVLSSDYCGACDFAKQLIKKMPNGKFKFYTTDYGNVPKKYQTSNATPTFLLFKKGKYIGQMVGISERFEKDLDKAFNK